MAGKAVPEIYCWEIQFDDLTVYLASSRRGAVRIGLTLERKSDCFTYFKKIFSWAGIVKDYRMNRNLIDAAEDALRNRPMSKDLALGITCTPFQLEAWKTIARIPFGQTKTYGEVAKMMGSPGGARAVGQAMGKNPLPLIFP